MNDYMANNQPWFNKSISTIEVRGGVTGIGSYAFAGDAYTVSVSSVTLADSVEEIGSRAFSFVHGLSELTLPTSMHTVASDAFLYANSLAGISVAPGNVDFVSVDGVLYTADMKKLVFYPDARAGSTYVIPEGVETVGDYALSCACRSDSPLEQVVFPTTLLTLEARAVEGTNCHLQTVCFLGDKPQGDNVFGGSTANAYYTYSAALGRTWTTPSSLGSRLNWNMCCTWQDGVVVIDHSFEYVAEVPASCTVDGTVAHQRCNVCGFRVTQYGAWVYNDSDLAIPAGHSYGAAEYRWTEDGSACMLAFPCANCEAALTADMTVTSEVKKEATCTAMGTTTYTATVEFEGAVYTDETDREDIPLVDHTPQILPAVAATDTQEGLTEGLKCSVCGEILVEQQVVPMRVKRLPVEFMVPSALKVIEEESFAGISAVTVELPEGIESIGDRAFADCPALAQIYIPDTVEKFGTGIFEGCTDDLVIFGKPGSPAETYADENGIRFETVDDF